MKYKKIIIIGLIVMGMLVSARGRVAQAAPHFTLSPATYSVSVGSTFVVDLGADSETQSIIAMDVVGTFDPVKLEVVSVEKNNTTNFNFVFDTTTPIIQNTNGRFEVTLSPSSTSVYDAQVVKGSLLRVRFKAKAAGVASVNLSCQAGSVTDTNMFNQNSEDVVSCAANQSGSFTLTAVGGDGDVVSDTTTVATTAAPTSELPQTGGIASTIGLVLFGTISVLGALMLRFL